MNNNPTPPSEVFQWRMPGAPGAPIRRLVVLLPDEDVDEPALANALWRLAIRRNASVHIIACVDNWSNEPRISLRIALLTALLRESNIDTTSEYVAGMNRLAIACERYAPGDGIVCFAEQAQPDTVKSMSVQFRPLSELIADQGMPVCELRGLVRRHAPSRVRTLASWALPLIVIAVSFALQVAFVRASQNWTLLARDMVLIVASAFEIVSVAWLADS